MDLHTFENLRAKIRAHPGLNGEIRVEEYPEPKSVQIIVRHESAPRIMHHLVIFPSTVTGMVVRKWWRHDHDVGIDTPAQGQASPEMVMQHIQQLLTPELPSGM